MNIEKLVASYFSKKRSESANQKRQHSFSTTNKCYQPQNHSFQPFINEMPKSIYRATTKTECSREQIIERLYTDRRTVEAKKTAKKLQEQQKQFKENCTFQPRTNAHSRRILRTQSEQENPFQRLYDDAINKKKLSESFNYQQQNKENYPFKPQTNYRTILNSQTCNMKPIYERIDEIVKQKREKMKQLQQNMCQKEMRDKPVINQISEKIISNKEEFKKSILERVSNYIQEKKKKADDDAATYERNLLKQCTFKPEINSTIEIASDFTTRQENYLRRIEQKMTSRRTQNTFYPEINKISEILMREQRQDETMEDKINRLTSDHTKRDKIQQIEREIYQQCTFVPEINAISKCLAAEHVSHKCNHTPKEEQYEFKPKINKTSQMLARQSKIRKSESADLKQQRKEFVNHLKMELEYQELKQCTFKPRINLSKPKQSANLAQVKGYESFVKKVDRINNLKQQEKQLREKLFNRQKNYKTRKSTTPVQFKLSKGYNTKQAIKQEIRSKFEKQCTFRPQIISLR